MRTAMLLSVIFIWASQPAQAAVRHMGFPAELLGIWAPSTESCGASPKSRVVIATGSVEAPNQICMVKFVVESATASGAIYSGHGSCVSRAKPEKKSFMNLIFRLQSDGRVSIGTGPDNLVEYQKCDR
jgi:hypothetical protein